MNGIKDWLGLAAAVIGLLVGVKLLVANPIEARLDRMETRINARFDAQQAETNQRFDVLQAETNRRFDAQQAETNRRFDALLEAIMAFDRRVARLEGRLDAQDAGEESAPQP